MSDLNPKELRAIFDHYDRDRSGCIEASEWTNFLRVLDPSLSEQEARSGLMAVDRSGNGRIEFDEFVKWWSER
jgi:Ca2+-binding EF-hand superfamily protein